MSLDFEELYAHLQLSEHYCSEHAKRALTAFRQSARVIAMGGKITLPPYAVGHCVKISMPHGTRSLGISFAISPDRMGNRTKYDEIGPGRPPSTTEIYLMGSIGDFSDLDNELGYHGDIQSFSWDSTLRAPEGGFAEVIDELVRLRAVLDSPVGATPSTN
jgi:hypothetical protein